jgi:hypothetical protein
LSTNILRTSQCPCSFSSSTKNKLSDSSASFLLYKKEKKSKVTRSARNLQETPKGGINRASQAQSRLSASKRIFMLFQKHTMLVILQSSNRTTVHVVMWTESGFFPSAKCREEPTGEVQPHKEARPLLSSLASIFRCYWSRLL